ncbi:MAG: tetratricopeptide repeat protein [Myxococcales bacterium]|nr:tetratricopeptide repeat protein [Myxococcales bacterium]
MHDPLASRRGAVVALVVLLLGAPSSAGKEDLGHVKELYKSGSLHFDLGQYPAALSDFKAAYLLRPDPVFLYNIAQCHRFLGNHAEAVRLYKNYLTQSPMAPNRKDVEAHIAAEETAAIDSQRKTEQTAAAEAGRREIELRNARAAEGPPPAPWFHDTLGWVFAVGGFAMLGGGVGLLGFGLSLKVSGPAGHTQQIAYDYVSGGTPFSVKHPSVASGLSGIARRGKLAGPRRNSHVALAAHRRLGDPARRCRPRLQEGSGPGGRDQGDGPGDRRRGWLQARPHPGAGRARADAGVHAPRGEDLRNRRGDRRREHPP